MVINPNQLLKRLEPSVRPAFLDGRDPAPRAPFETHEFDQMLALVSRGKVQGRPVEIGFEIEPEPDEPEQQRLAAAADLAEAAGVRSAVLLLDGRGLLLDVGSRTLTAELASGAGSPIVRIDAAIYVAGENDASQRGVITPGRGLPGAGLLPPAVAQRLEQLESNTTNESSAA